MLAQPARYTLQLLFVATLFFTSSLRAQPTCPPPAPVRPVSNEQPTLAMHGSDTVARLDRLEAEWEMLRQDLAADCAAGDSDFECTGFRPRTWCAVAEMSLVKPRFEDGAEEDADGEVPDFDMRLAPRISLLYERPSGSAWRATFWQFDHRSTAERADHIELLGDVVYFDLNSYTVDLDVVHRIDFCILQLTLGAGCRYGSFEQKVISVDQPDFRSKRSHGIGPTLYLDFRRSLGCWGLGTVARTRAALLVGEATWSDRTGSANTDDIGATLEMQIGFEWRKECTPLGDIFAHLVYEHQSWFGAGTYFNEIPGAGPTSPNIRRHDHDVAFMGLGFAIGLQR